MSKRVALFPGTFDPFTNGHLDLVQRGLEIFDEVVVAIGVNATKRHLFSLEQRLTWIKEIFADEPRVKIGSYEGLTTNYAKVCEARFLLRGLRTTIDFLYEKQIAFVNEDMGEHLQSVFIMSQQANSSVSSTIVRDLIRHDGNYHKYIPMKEDLKGLMQSH
jgi:pantetheine-phosphate adenylyltransferase